MALHSSIRLLVSVCLGSLAVPATAAGEPVVLMAAGSLKAAMTDMAAAFAPIGGVQVVSRFGPSGLLRKKIEGGEPFNVFASANMAHPQALGKAGKAGPVTRFARNRLCGLATAKLPVTTDNFLATLMDPAVRVGTSTPKADPSGDYAFALFDRAEALRPGAAAALKSRALQLTGGPDSAVPPKGRNNYAWVMDAGKADLFLTYCTNAVLARQESPSLKIVAVPEALAVGADYGITLSSASPGAGQAFIDFVLAEQGQKILAGYGFAPPER